MAGTKASSKRSAQTIIEKYGPDHYAKIGKIGGSKPKTRPAGFKADPELARRAGLLGAQAKRKRRDGV